MRIEGEYVFEGPREEVWKLVRDPEVLASALPGAQSMEQVSESEFEGKMNVRMGPVSGVFAGRVVIADEKPPESCTLTVDGRGAPGFVRGTGQMQLTDQGDGTTLMKYEGELQIGGRLAGVGQRLMDSVSKSIIRQGLESMNALLRARLSPEPQVDADEKVEAQAAPAAPFTPPSEVEFAAGVAKDVVKDLAADIFSPDNQTAWLAAAIALIGVVVGFCLGRVGTRRR